MVNTNDKKLAELSPSMSWDEFKDDLEYIINDGDFHSDEVSETDIEKSKIERRQNIRPKSKKNKEDNHVLHVKDKRWRSRRVSNYYNIGNFYTFAIET